MTHARLAVALAALSTLAACKDDTETLEGLLDDYAEERLAIRDLVCTCPSALGYATSDECETGMGSVDAAAKRCIVDAFEGHVSLGEDYFECVLVLQDEYGDCLNAALTCGDDWFVPCGETYNSGVVETCPELSTSIAAATNDCLPD